MLQSAPRALVASAGLNTFSTAIEGLMSRSGDPIADALLMHAVRLLGARLPELARRDDAAIRAELVIAAVLCGQGTDHTGAGVTTVLGHAIGARHEMENGVANAIVLPHAIRFNAEQLRPDWPRSPRPCASRSEGQTPAKVVAALEAMFRSLGLPSRLGEVGVPREALPAVAEIAMGDWFLARQSEAGARRARAARASRTGMVIT